MSRCPPHSIILNNLLLKPWAMFHLATNKAAGLAALTPATATMRLMHAMQPIYSNTLVCSRHPLVSLQTECKARKFCRYQNRDLYTRILSVILAERTTHCRCDARMNKVKGRERHATRKAFGNIFSARGARRWRGARHAQE